MNNLYPHVDDIMQNNVCIALEDGSNNVFYVDLGKLRLVYKSLFATKTAGLVKTMLKQIDAPIRNYYSDMLSDHVAKAASGETFDIEYKVLDEWKKRHIPCMQVLERQDKALVYRHMHSINFSRLLRRGTDCRHQYLQLLDIVDSIRGAAKTENNPMLLHPDLLPKNFLYLFETDSTIAIDPGLKLKNLPLEELDAKINLTFIRDLNIYENGDFYVNGFLETLNREEKKYLRELNVPIRPDALLYYNMKSEVARIIRGGPRRNIYERYAYKNIHHLNKLIDMHIQ